MLDDHPTLLTVRVNLDNLRLLGERSFRRNHRLDDRLESLVTFLFQPVDVVAIQPPS